MPRGFIGSLAGCLQGLPGHQPTGCALKQHPIPSFCSESIGPCCEEGGEGLQGEFGQKVREAVVQVDPRYSCPKGYKICDFVHRTSGMDSNDHNVSDLTQRRRSPVSAKRFKATNEQLHRVLLAFESVLG